MVRHQRRAAALAAVASALFVPISAVALLAGARFRPRAATCRSAASPVLAAGTSPHVPAALSFPLAVDAIAPHDEGSGLWCAPDHARPVPHTRLGTESPPGTDRPARCTEAAAEAGTEPTGGTAITGATALARPLTVERVLRRAARELGRRLARFDGRTVRP